jgi:dTDP-4-dehydrorhamnose reductase
MKVAVFGASGMVGSYVVKHLENVGYQLIKLSRSELDVRYASHLNTAERFRQLSMQSDDVAINCAGTLKPRVQEVGKAQTIAVNSLWPHTLADVCDELDLKCFHISTDGIFSGDRGNYSEEDRPDPVDFYGQTKLLGESDKCAVIRVCPIGEEGETRRSLFEWVKSCKDKKVEGFVNHFWNGLTGLQLAKVIGKLISDQIYWHGVKHIHSPDSMSKAALVNEISKIYDLNISITEVEAPETIDKTLRSVSKIGLEIPIIKEQLIELKNSLNR